VADILASGLLLLLWGQATPVAVEREPFEVDLSGSRVRIHLGRAGLLKVLGHDHEIDAPIAEGRVEVAGRDPGRSSVRLRFEARRLAIVPGTEPAEDVPKVEERMRGEDVLDAVHFSDIVFVSSSVAAEAGEPGRYHLRVRGTLELKGRLFPVEIPLDVRPDDRGLDARGEVAWRLRDLGVEPPSVGGVVRVADQFRVTFEIAARRAAPPP
jgi:polyisoprenoid-binding protein YceI